MGKKADLNNIDFVSICEAFYKLSKIEKRNLIKESNPFMLNERQLKNMVVLSRAIERVKFKNAEYNPANKDKRKMLDYIMKGNRDQRFCWSHNRCIEYMKERGE